MHEWFYVTVIRKSVGYEYLLAWEEYTETKSPLMFHSSSLETCRTSCTRRCTRASLMSSSPPLCSAEESPQAPMADSKDAGNEDSDDQ